MNKKIIKFLYIAVFAIFIFLPLVSYFLNFRVPTKKDFHYLEKRNPNKFPKFKKNDLKNYLSEFEKWVNDHFAFRLDLARLNTNIMYSAFKTSPVERRAVLGKKDFLFYTPSVLLYRRERVIDDKHILSTAQLLSKLRDIAKLKNSDFYFVVAPDKVNLYSEYLPNWCTRLDNSLSSKEKLFNKCKEFGVKTIDLYPALFKAKQVYNDDLYGKTDTHWTTLGAFIGFRDIVNSLNGDRDEKIPLFALSNYTVHKHKPGYDLAGMVNLKGKIVDISTVLSFNYKFTDKLKAFDGAGKKVKFHDASYVGNWDAYSIYNETVNNGVKVLVIRDSFAIMLSRYLVQSFSEVHFRHYFLHNGDKNLSNLLDRYKVDVVLFEISEREIFKYSQRAFNIISEGFDKKENKGDES